MPPPPPIGGQPPHHIVTGSSTQTSGTGSGVNADARSWYFSRDIGLPPVINAP